MVHVLPHAYPLGGTERAVLDLLESPFLTDLDQRVVFLRGGLLGPFAEMRVLAHCNQLRPNHLRAAAALTELRPRVIHGWLLRGNIFAASMRFALPRTVILTSERNVGHNLTPAKRALERLVARWEDLCIANSEAVRQAACARLPRRRRIRVIRPGIPDPASTRRGRRFSCLAVGRLEPVKDHATVLRAWRLVLNHDPDATLAIVGEGPERQALERLMSELAIEHSVSLLGTMDPLPMLRASTVYVSTSRSEGFSRALLEALALRVPAVATGVGGVEELPAGAVQPVSIGDSAATAKAIVSLLESSRLRARLANAGRAAYEASFTLERCHSAFRNLYGTWLLERARRT